MLKIFYKKLETEEIDGEEGQSSAKPRTAPLHHLLYLFNLLM
jgi:hypothetical protein